jgi:serine/threonine-protein kinase RsbT
MSERNWTDEVIVALGPDLPPTIARTILGTTLRGEKLGEEDVSDDMLSAVVVALERKLLMFIVDGEKRKMAIERLRDVDRRAARERPTMSPPTQAIPPPAPTPVNGTAGNAVIQLRDEKDLGHACETARVLAKKVGFSLIEQTKVATAVSELARNIVLYAKKGEIRLTVLTAPRRGIEVVAEDAGPGIPDVNAVMSRSYRSRTGMGMGLKGAKRLMDSLDIETRPGGGTTISARRYVA